MKRLVFIVLLVLLLEAFHFKPIVAEEEIVQADLVIENVEVFTVDKVNEKAEAIAVKNGKFVYVGDREGVQAYKGPKTKVMRLDNQLLLPGFIDGHNYAYLKAEKLYLLDLTPYSNFEQYKRAILTYRAQNPQLRQLRAVGWNQNVTEEASQKSGQTPRELIDQLVSDIPFVAFSNHRDELWVNSKAIEISGLDVETEKQEQGQIDLLEKGELGVVQGQFIKVVIQSLPQSDFTVEQYKIALLEFQKEAATYGITSVFIPFRYHSENLLKAIDELDQQGKLTLFYELGLYVDPFKGLEQIDSLKEWREKYQGENYSYQTVKLYGAEVLSKDGFAWEKDKFYQLLELLDREGFRIHVQADGELEEIVKGFEYVRELNGKQNFKHTISKIPFMTRENLTQFRKFRLIPSVQPSLFYYTMGVKEEVEELKDLHRMKSYFERGLPVSSSSDYPFGELNPLYGIETGMTRLHAKEEKNLKPLWPKESATLKQMLRSYTIYPARQIGKEERIGKIRVGKQADFIILDKNIFKIPPSEISEAKVVLTYFKGKEIYRDDSQIEE
ncbi:amidohydrolase [Ureibacillus sp. FSL K6-2830]|uniref:amidohydrolase n=1 Tax=Ureibacillus sp. FSL K6-2830 TaxID=2954610 RepID=UPI0030FA8869